MISFKDFIVEMAMPSDIDRARVYYHGTSKPQAGENILKNGIEPGDIALPERFKKYKGRPNLVPVPGKVYITPSISYAQIYAIGGDIAGSAIAGLSYKSKGTGYLFVIDGKDLADIQPDEDSVGELIYSVVTKNEFKTELSWLVSLAKQKLTGKQWAQLIDADYVMYAYTGKKLLPLMSDAQKLQLIGLGAHIAHTGKLIPKEAYKIDLSKISQLKRDGSNFFDHAEKLSV